MLCREHPRLQQPQPRHLNCLHGRACVARLDNHSTEINDIWSILEKPSFNRFSSKTILKWPPGSSKLRREKKFGCARLPGLEFRAAALLANENMSQESTMLDLPFGWTFFPRCTEQSILIGRHHIYTYIYIYICRNIYMMSSCLYTESRTTYFQI